MQNCKYIFMSYFIFVNSDNKKCLYLYILPVPTPIPPNFRKKIRAQWLRC